MFFGNKEPIEMDSETIKKNLKKQFRNFLGLLLLIMIGFLASQSWFTVSEQENAVVTMAGRVSSVRTAGLHFKIPFVQNVHMVDMTTRVMTLGYIEPGMANQANMMYDVGDNLMISNDFNIVSIDFYAEWRVIDPVKFLFNSERPQLLLSNIIQSSARGVVSAHNIDRVMTDGRFEIQGAIRETVGAVLEDYDLGIMITNIIIQDAEPPTEEVVLAFKSVEDARQRADTLRNEANRYANEVIPAARAEAYRITREAEAIKEARINEATGQTARFNEMFLEYRNYPEITRTRMYLETMEDVLPDMRLIIDGTQGGSPLDGGSGILRILDIGQGVE